MIMKFGSVKLINPLDVAVGNRIVPPTPQNITLMAQSFEKHGQLAPIAVMPVTLRTYRVIAGATRLEAAIKLGWKVIRAEVMTGTELQFEAHEILENLDRSDLTKEQRKMLRERKREIERKMFEHVDKAKGGRGKQGGMRAVARQAGIPQSTARDLLKLSENDVPRSISKPANTKLGVYTTRLLREFLDELWKAKNFPSLSETICAVIRGDAPNQREWIAEKNMHLGSDGIRH
jgi:hypothetical protein